MPINDNKKFKKFTLTKENNRFDVEEAIAETVGLCERMRIKNVNITLLADDFFKEHNSYVEAYPMCNDVLVPSHNHNYFEINYVCEGKCVEYIGNRTIILEKGDFLVMPPTVYHCPNPVGDSRCVDILIKSEWMNEIAKRLVTHNRENYLTHLQRQNTYMIFNADKSLAFETANSLREMFENKEKLSYHHELYAESLALKMLFELSQCKFSETYYAIEKKGISRNTTEDVLRYIKDNLSTVTLENTASHFGYSPAHLSKLIKKYTGNSFSTYLSLERMIRAEYLLAKTDIAISKIPSIIGIESKEYFSRVFKKYNKVSPMQYRKTHK